MGLEGTFYFIRFSSELHPLRDRKAQECRQAHPHAIHMHPPEIISLTFSTRPDQTRPVHLRHAMLSLSHILYLESTNRFVSARKHQAQNPNWKHGVTESTALIGFLNLQVGNCSCRRRSPRLHKMKSAILSRNEYLRLALGEAYSIKEAAGDAACRLLAKNKHKLKDGKPSRVGNVPPTATPESCV